MSPEVEVGQLWRKRGGREELRIQRHWLARDPEEWLVRGHPTHGGKPLVCPDSYLLEHYEPAAASLEETQP